MFLSRLSPSWLSSTSPSGSLTRLSCRRARPAWWSRTSTGPLSGSGCRGSPCPSAFSSGRTPNLSLSLLSECGSKGSRYNFALPSSKTYFLAPQNLPQVSLHCDAGGLLEELVPVPFIRIRQELELVRIGQRLRRGTSRDWERWAASDERMWEALQPGGLPSVRHCKTLHMKYQGRDDIHWDMFVQSFASEVS